VEPSPAPKPGTTSTGAPPPRGRRARDGARSSRPAARAQAGELAQEAPARSGGGLGIVTSAHGTRAQAVAYALVEPQRGGTHDEAHTALVIVGAVRTPIGAIGGALSGLQALDLSRQVIAALLRATKVDPENVDYTALAGGRRTLAHPTSAKTAAELAGVPADGARNDLP